MVMLLNRFLKCIQCLLNHIDKIHGLFLQDDLPAGDAGYIQQVIYQSGQVTDLPGQHFPEPLGSFFLSRCDGFEE
jgi:hypothetical protein